MTYRLRMQFQSSLLSACEQQPHSNAEISKAPSSPPELQAAQSEGLRCSPGASLGQRQKERQDGRRGRAGRAPALRREAWGHPNLHVRQDVGQAVPEQWHYQQTNIMVNGDVKTEQNTETLQTTAASCGP